MPSASISSCCFETQVKHNCWNAESVEFWNNNNQPSQIAHGDDQPHFPRDRANVSARPGSPSVRNREQFDLWCHQIAPPIAGLPVACCLPCCMHGLISADLLNIFGTQNGQFQMKIRDNKKKSIRTTAWSKWVIVFMKMSCWRENTRRSISRSRSVIFDLWSIAIQPGK